MAHRLFAVGDIHGHYKTLKALIRMIKVKRGDTIVFLGDYIDRGPNSRKVIRLILALRRLGVNCICLIGNHESMFIDYIKAENGIEVFPDGHDMCPYVTTGKLYMHRSNCGYQTIADYLTYENVQGGKVSPDDTGEFYVKFKLPNSHLNFLRALKPYHVDGKVLFVHAGMNAEALQETSLDDALNLAMEDRRLRGFSPLLWQRKTLHVPVGFGMLIVHGHWMIKTVLDFYGRNSEFIPSDFLQKLESAAVAPHVVQGKLNLDFGIASSENDGAICAVEFINGLPQPGVLSYDLDG